MDLLLIQPNISIDERFGRSLGSVGGHLPPLGLVSIAAYLIKNSFSVSIIDASVMDLSVKELVKKVEGIDPRIIGITSITPTFHSAVKTAHRIKDSCSEKPVIIGGHHATIFPTKVLIDNPCFDISVFGEGELTILEIMRKLKKVKYSLKKDSALRNINGIAFRSRSKVIKNPPREPIKNLDELPYPARHLLQMRKYVPLPNQYKKLPVVHMTAIRGCPNSCIFCSNNKVFGRRIRAKSPEYLLREIRHVMESYGAREIAFFDDNLTVNREWITRLCNLMIQEKLDIVWSCYSRADTVDKKLLQKMSEAGCWNIFYGFESGSQELLDIIGKGITIDQIKNATRWTKEAGIEVRGSFMLGLPGETPELGKKTIDFAIELELDYAQFSITTPFPGTVLYDTVNEYGELDEDYSNFTCWKPAFLPFGYKNREEIVNMERKAMRCFYLRPKYFFNRLKTINSPQDITRYAKGLRFLAGFVR